MLSVLKEKINRLDEHTKEVFQKSVSSTIVKLVGMLAGLFLSVFLGRVLGADGLGIINLANRLVEIILILGLVGMRQVIIKEIGIAYNEQDFNRVKSIMLTSYIINGTFTFIISILLIYFSDYISTSFFHEPKLTFPLIIFLIAAVPQIFSRIFSSGLIGFRKIWQSNLVEQSLSILITSVLLISLWLINYQIDIDVVAVLYAIGRIIVTLTVGFYWKKISRDAIAWNFIPKKLFGVSIFMFLITISAVVTSNSTIIILGSLSNATNLGLYSVALRLALLTSFFLQVVNSTVAPKAAYLFKNKNISQLNIMVQKVSKILFLLGTIPVIIFIFGGNFILHIWGNEFTEAYWILIILGIGQMFNIGTGSSGVLLMMCGFEKLHAIESLIFMLFNVLACYLLGTLYGVLGVAVAYSLTVILDNVTRVIITKIKVGVLTLPKFI